MTDSGHGAYGFRLILKGHAGELPGLSPLDRASPAVDLEWRQASVLVDRNRVDGECVAIGERGASLVEVHREPASITLELPEATSADALVHPLLTAPISILARWRGDLTLHAGGFYANERAWAMVGAREAGKSTALASLARRGCPLLADDLIVLDGDVVRAGPACIDLRPDVAARMPGARFLGEVGGRPRYRLATPHGPARTRIGGFFLLDWSDDGRVRVESVPLAEALQVIYEQEYIGLLGPADPKKVLDLLGTPMWRVSRPPDWSFTEETVERILATTAAAA
jgi:hypothetical protein